MILLDRVSIVTGVCLPKMPPFFTKMQPPFKLSKGQFEYLFLTKELYVGSNPTITIFHATKPVVSIEFKMVEV